MEYVFLIIGLLYLFVLYSIAVSLGIIAEELSEKER